ncbi:MAG: hypothetical protein RLZZ444_2016, partial [Pseudomonadota bacterium]
MMVHFSTSSSGLSRGSTAATSRVAWATEPNKEIQMQQILGTS